MPSRKKTSSYYSQFEPDNNQVNYEDMFAALTPSGALPKSGTKRRLTALPQMSCERYIDDLLYRSRTKPLPPLPSDKDAKHRKGTGLPQRPASGSWVGMFKWMKSQSVEQQAPVAETTEPRTRQSSANRPTHDMSRKNSDRSDRSTPSRAKHYAPPPWSTKSTNAANNRTLMYGDLAEFPATNPKRSDSTGSGSRNRSIKGIEGRSSRSSLSRPEPQGFAAEKPAGSGEVSREQFEFVWNQYQQLSKTMQEALQQRTTELAR